MTGWRKEHCQSQPDEIQRIDRDIVIQRQNIERVDHEADETMETFTEWICDSREMTESEYQMLLAIVEIDTQNAIDDYTEQLIEEGVL